MRAFLAQQTERRQQRARLIADRLDKAHIPGAWEGALRLASTFTRSACVVLEFNLTDVKDVE